MIKNDKQTARKTKSKKKWAKTQRSTRITLIQRNKEIPYKSKTIRQGQNGEEIILKRYREVTPWRVGFFLIDFIFENNFRFTIKLSTKYRKPVYPCGVTHHSLGRYLHPATEW